MKSGRASTRQNIAEEYMNRRRVLFTVLFVVISSTASLSKAADIWWNDAYPNDHLWSSTGNWLGNKVPTVSDTARLDEANKQCLIDSTVSAVCNAIHVGHSYGPCYLDITTGGTLTVNNYFSIGHFHGFGNTVTVNGGDVDVGGDMMVGNWQEGILHMLGGTLDVGGKLYLAKEPDGIGHILLDGGTINCADFEIVAVGSVDIKGNGLLIIDGDKKNLIHSYIDNGWITAYDGNGAVLYDYNVTNSGKTTLQAKKRVDFNGDKWTDWKDLKIFSIHWLENCPAPADCNGADLYPEGGDQIVDFRDFVKLAEQWLEYSGPPLPLPRTARMLRQEADYAIWYENPVEKVYLDDALPTEQATTVSIKAAKNEYEPFQLVITPQTDWHNVRLEFSNMSGPDSIMGDNFRYYRVEDVNVTSTTYNLSLGRLGWTPDPLPPEALSDLQGGKNSRFWILLKVPCDVDAGTYTGTIDVWKGQSLIEQIPLQLEVWDFEVPDERSLQMCGGLNSGKDSVEIMENLAEHRVSSPEFKPSIKMNIDRNAGLVTIDTNDFDSIAEYNIEQLHNNLFLFPCTGWVSHGGTHHWLPGTAWYGIPYFSDEVNNILNPEFVNLYSQMITRVSQHLKSKGWLQYFYIKFVDELEGEDDVVKVDKVYELVKSIEPLVRTNWTGDNVPEPLWDSVSFWQINEDHYDSVKHQQRKDAGDTFFVYNNARMLIDYHYMRVRSFFWHLWTNQPQLDGKIFWSLNAWYCGNPWLDPKCSSTTRNGDGFLLYPPRDVNEGAIVNSIRWELIREGLEDYEYLHMLKELVEQAQISGGDPNDIAEAQAVLDRAIEVAWDKSRVAPANDEPYTKDETLLYEIREQLANSILKLK
jgi:hypothetical protein